MIMIGNETDLHYKVVDMIRRFYPDSILVAGLLISGGGGRGGGLINFPPLKRGDLLERGGLFERGGLIVDLRYVYSSKW